MEESDKITADLISGSFEISINNPEMIKQVLAARISDLLASNPILLRSIFYRIDLNESQLAIALNTMNGEELYNELAEQVILRMKKKAETRLKYRRT